MDAPTVTKRLCSKDEREMRERAGKMGANAIVGVSFGYETMGQGNGMIMISISGTAVVID